MRDFDKARAERASRDRTLRIGGHDFHFRAGIEPELYAEYADLFSTPVLEEVRIVNDALIRGHIISTPGENGQAASEEQRSIEGSWAKISTAYSSLASDSSPPTQADTIALLDRVVTEFLVPEDRDVWRELRQSGQLDQPITEMDMIELINHMTEVTTRRPTSPASDSGPGDETLGTTSTPDLQLAEQPS